MSKCVSVTGHRLALGPDVASLGRVTLYAAYGTNLDPARMSERCPHSPLRSTGWLTGWRLTFGGEEHGWDGALATIVEDPIEQVFVAVYDVTPEDVTSLDRWESADTGPPSGSGPGWCRRRRTTSRPTAYGKPLGAPSAVRFRCCS